MASCIKANPSGNKQPPKNTIFPMTGYELLIHLNTDWIAKSSQQKATRFNNAFVIVQNKINTVN